MVKKGFLLFAVSFIFYIKCPLILYSQEIVLPQQPVEKQDIDTPTPNNWLSNSNSKEDSIIITYFNAADFDEKINAIYDIGKRKDKDFSLILDNVYYQEYDSKNEKDFILFLMLDTFFKDEKSVIATLESFLRVCNDISIYKNSTLRKKIIEKALLLDQKNAETVLIKAALFLLNEGKKYNKFNKEMLEESRIFFLYSGKIDSLVLEDYRQEIYVTVTNIPYWFLRSR